MQADHPSGDFQSEDSVEEKEAISSDRTCLPSWHALVLMQRQAEVANGTSKFRDWEEVKRELIDFAQYKLHRTELTHLRVEDLIPFDD